MIWLNEEEIDGLGGLDQSKFSTETSKIDSPNKIKKIHKIAQAIFQEELNQKASISSIKRTSTYRGNKTKFEIVPLESLLEEQ